MSAGDTIYALASGRGKAGVAVVRISGADAYAAVAALTGGIALVPRQAMLVALRAGDMLIDQALALYFPAPRSFTGENVVELHVHGSAAVVRALFDALATLPTLRAAQPGEFSRRAFMHGKMDLIQAEGVADLIDAETKAQHTQALKQLSGEMSEKFLALRESVIEPLALLEAFIDFPDEEIPPQILAETQSKVDALKGVISHLLDDGHIGEKIRDGVEIVIFGPPNVGKSSLINALSNRDVAIVADEPGTTRDMIEAHLELGGYSVTLVDTAGLREAEGAVEAEGVRRAARRAKESDIKICMLEAECALEHYQEMRAHIDNNTLIVINKIDNVAPPELPQEAILLSVARGTNIKHLLDVLVQRLEQVMGKAPSPLITRARHRDALTKSLQSLNEFSVQQPLELACENLRQAAVHIGKITGKVSVDDILDVVFSRFCIGK